MVKVDERELANIERVFIDLGYGEQDVKDANNVCYKVVDHFY